MKWLRERREELDINQDELTARLQLEGVAVTRATLSHWEVGRHSPPMNDPEFRLALARSLKLSIREVLQRSGYEVIQTHTDAGERAADIVDELPPDGRELALDLLRTIEKRFA